MNATCRVMLGMRKRHSGRAEAEKLEREADGGGKEGNEGGER